MKIRVIIFILYLLMTATAGFADTITNLNYVTEVYPPSNYLVEGKITGLSVEVLKRIWSKLRIPEQRIEVYPWARAYYLAQNQPNTVIFTVVRTPERENSFKWVGPVSRNRVVLTALSVRKIRIGQDAELKALKIGTIRDDVGEVFLKRHGVAIEDCIRVSDLDKCLRLLKNGDVDVICVMKTMILNADKMKILNHQKLEVVYQLNETVNYFAFHPQTPDEIVMRFQEALKAVENERVALVKKYGLLP